MPRARTPRIWKWHIPVIRPAALSIRESLISTIQLLEYPPQEKTLSRFEQAMQRTLTLAKTMEESQPALSHYYQGAALRFPGARGGGATPLWDGYFQRRVKDACSS